MIRLYGTVCYGGRVLEGAYVQLKGPSGEFTAERRTDETGRFLFYPTSGSWHLLGQAAGGLRAERSVELRDGQALEVTMELAPPS